MTRKRVEVHGLTKGEHPLNPLEQERARRDDDQTRDEETQGMTAPRKAL